jgi:hypothetical protein
MNFFPEIPGVVKLFQWFDGAPSFHDAQVLELHLERSGKSGYVEAGGIAIDVIPRA